MMKLKPAILALLDRHDLKRLVDDLGIADVDRRSAEAMRAALARSHKAQPEMLLGYARKEQLPNAEALLQIKDKFDLKISLK